MTSPDIIILIGGTAWLIPLLRMAFNDPKGENS